MSGLLYYLRQLQSDNGGDRRDVIATVFRGVTNRMVSGYLLRDVVNKIDEIHFTSNDEIFTLSHLYESLLKEMRDSAGDAGEFYTPRPVVKFIVEIMKPQIGETVLDPACGTGLSPISIIFSPLLLSKQFLTMLAEQVVFWWKLSTL